MIRLAMLGVLLLGAVGTASAQMNARRDPEVERVLAQFAHEPTVQEVQRAAVEYYQVAPQQVLALRSRARNKNWLPTLTGWFQNSTTSFTRAHDDLLFRALQDAQGRPKERTNESADFLGYNVLASWALPQLLFNAEELDVLSLIGIQDGLVREVTTNYYLRRRLQVSMMLAPGTTVEARISDEMRLQELTGLLDGYTGGFMTRRIKEAKERGGRRSREMGE